MPLMKEWVEIHVDEDLLIPVVRELLDMAVNPNHVEVVYGTEGRVILAEIHLAEHWYQERLKRDEESSTEVHAGSYEVVASANTSQQGTEELIPLPAKRGPGRPRNAPPSASPDGEES
jgi:hypothetical protein